jgi:hypothetical protein
MAEQENTLLNEIAECIGVDFVHLTADDSERHFDPASVAFAFAGILAASFLKGFVDAASKDFERLGIASYSALRTLLGKLRSISAKTAASTINEEDTATLSETRHLVSAATSKESVILSKHLDDAKAELVKALNPIEVSAHRRDEIVSQISKSMAEYLEGDVQ